MREHQDKPKKAGKWKYWILIALFVVPVLLVLAGLIRGQLQVSETENRTLTQYPELSGHSFLNGTFQNTLEDALGDQMLFSEEIKENVQDGHLAIQNLQKQMLYAVHPELKDGYTQIVDGYYHYNAEENRIVEKAQDYSDRQEHLEKLAQQFREIPETRLYLYFIENSRVVDFDHPEKPDEVYTRVIKAFQPDTADVFRISGYDEYKKYFYQTDHHWNYLGSYIGYQAIFRMLHPGDEETAQIQPTETIELPVVFQGSYARQTHQLCADENFTFQKFDMPEYRTVIQGKQGTYGHLSLYMKGKYPTDSLRNHYAYCFGGDFGQIEYDFGDQGRGNLPLVASSYSNPINALIAAGYDHTWVVDLRYYASWAGQAFQPETFCKEHEIQDILLLGDANFFFVDDMEKGGGE